LRIRSSNRAHSAVIGVSAAIPEPSSEQTIRCSLVG